MDIQRLMKIIEPPTSPRGVSCGNWPEIEAQLGTRLPADYKVFIDTYGSGVIDGFLTVFNPFWPNKYINLIDQVPLRLEALGGLRAFADRHPEWLPYRSFPDFAGLFPFAGSDNGDTIYWLTDGHPDNWRIVAGSARSPRFAEFQSNAVTFLADILTKTIACGIFPRDFPSERPIFTQIVISQ